MSWLGKIRTHRREEAWSASLWQTFFVTTMGDQILVIVETPLTACGCKKLQLGTLGVLVIISVLVPPTRVPRRLTTGRLTGWSIRWPRIFFEQHTKWKHNRCLKTGDIIVGTSSCLVTKCTPCEHEDPVPLVLDLHIAHERFGSSSDPSLNGHLWIGH